MLGLVRATASRADAESVDRCILEAVDALPGKCEGTPPIKTSSVVNALWDADLKLVQSDKEGGFVVIPSGLYEKALSAVQENFWPAQIDPRKARREALRACQGEALSNLASSVRKADGLSLQAFFTVKTHKEGTPFRVIVSERGSWQRVLGEFLQRSLPQLKIDDPFLVRSPTEVSDYLQQQCPTHVFGFSLDIKDLYYSLPHSELMEVVSEGIDHYGSVRFQNASGVDANTFLDLLGLYLRSSLVEFNSEFFVQRKGVCIGSCLAPMLSDLLLA